MKAPDIRYECPLHIEDALRLLSATDSIRQPLAGGQSLLPMMHLRLARPEILLDLNKLAELDFIRKDHDSIHIGAMVRCSELLKSELVGDNIPLFAMAIPFIAHEAIRNRGTIGGSAALADPAAEMPALLLALNATVVLVSQHSSREVAADDFFIGIYETARAEDELIHSFRIPLAKDTHRFGFYELARRYGDYAMAGVAITAETVQPFRGLRIAFFGVADRALRVTEVEDGLQGCMFDDEASFAKAESSLKNIAFLPDANATTEMKAHLVKVVLRRALHSMAEVSS